jgi:two-component system OmpR family response regulator/two-component system response regulator RstA
MSNTLQTDERKQLMLVEDDYELASLIKDFLVKYEFDVDIVGDGYEAVTRIINEQPDIVILDVMLPGQTGMEVCRQVRSHYKGAILMQTALDDDLDQMMGLELGADDYVIKQVQPRLLLSRIRALLRRFDHHSNNPSNVISTAHERRNIQVGFLMINTANRTVALNDMTVELTTAEFELLYLLARTPGKVVSRETIVQQIRGYEYDGLDRSIDRRISRLRKKLQDDQQHPKLIKTIRGQGYQLCEHIL